VLAGILSMPVLADYIARPCEPFLIAAERIQGFGGVVFDAIAGRMAKRLQQSGGCQDRYVMRFETEKPRRLEHVQPCGEYFPTVKFILLFDGIHMLNLPISRGNEAGVCDTQITILFTAPPLAGIDPGTRFGADAIGSRNSSGGAIFRRLGKGAPGCY
jgi:hypothetical protein